MLAIRVGHFFFKARWVNTSTTGKKMMARIKDMIIRGGENIYPREVEEFLYTNEKIKAA